MSPEAIITALISLPEGKSIVYFVGFLDMAMRGDVSTIKAAVIAQKLAQQRRVHLTQRRLGLPVREGNVDWHSGIGPGFEYIATGASRRKDNGSE